MGYKRLNQKQLIIAKQIDYLRESADAKVERLSRKIEHIKVKTGKKIEELKKKISESY